MKFRTDMRAFAARLQPLLPNRLLFSLSNAFGDDPKLANTVLIDDESTLLPMYRSLCPRIDSTGFWLMMDQDRRPYWRMFQPGAMSSEGLRELEKYMSSSGTITVYNEKDRTQIVLDTAFVDKSLIQQLLQDRILGQPPYFIRFTLAGTCLWISETREELDAHLIEILNAVGVECLPRGLRVDELTDEEASRIELYRDIVQNPLNWMNDAVCYEHESDVLRYSSVGNHAPVLAMLGEDWGHSVIGAPFDVGFDDRSFDEQTSIAYKRVFESGLPHVSQVTGPLLTEEGPFFQNYYRVIAPIPQRPGQVISVARLAGMAAPFHPSRIDQECA